MTIMLRVLASLLIIFSLMGCGMKKTEKLRKMQWARKRKRL